MTQTEYDREDEFETYLCFSAVFRQKLSTATDSLEELTEETDAEYVRETVKKIMKPLCDLAEQRICKFPYTPENAATVHLFCTEFTDAIQFIEEQEEMYEEYFTLLPVLRSQEECFRKWNEIKSGFGEMKQKLQEIYEPANPDCSSA